MAIAAIIFGALIAIPTGITIWPAIKAHFED